jgi:PadR family transcriptional regulator, regulatory protein PadR
LKRRIKLDKEQLKGNLDLIILAHVSKTDDYGGAIVKKIYDESNQQYKMSEGTLYSLLKRLEKKGLLSSYWGDETNGGRRRYYSITDAGKVTFKEKLESWRSINKMIENSIRGG